MPLTEDQKQQIARQLIAKRIERKKREAERRRAVSAQKERMEKNRCAAQRCRAALALQRAASEHLRRSSKQTSTPASDMTPEQRRRMEENRRSALKKKAANSGAVSHTSSASRSHASAHALAVLPLNRNELVTNGVVTSPHRVLQAQALASQSCTRQKVVKTLGSAGPHLKNRQILTVKGVHCRETNVLLGGAVLLVRELDNVSIYLCFFI